MKELASSEEYGQFKNLIDQIVWRTKRLPEQVFKIPYSHFAFLDFDRVLYEESFIEKLQNFLTSMGEKDFFFAVLEPDAEEFFFHHYGNYPAFSFDVKENTNRYFEILDACFNNTLLDSIQLLASVILIASSSLEWALLADRDLEITVAAFQNSQAFSRFTDEYGSEETHTLEQVIDGILRIVFIHSEPKVLRQIGSELRKNYSP